MVAKPRLPIWAAGWLLVMPLAGCESRVPTYPVKGQVVYKDGQPFTGGTVIWFESKIEPYTRASGILDGQGNFVLSTDREGNGAMEGPHRVRIAKENVEGTNLYPHLVKIIDPKHFEFSSSGIEVNIKADGPNELKIEVDRPSGAAP